MKDRCKQYTANTIMKGNDGTEYAAKIINCSECPEHIECDGEEKLYELIVYDNEINKDSLYEFNEVN